MKKYVACIACIICLFGRTIVCAEAISDGYYLPAEGQTDSLLKTSLSQLAQGGQRYSYGTAGYTWQDHIYYQATWSFFPYSDIRDDGTVWDMYSRSVRYYPAENGESGCSLNIEHCFPKSWWGGQDGDAYRDLYHLNPADARANQTGKNAYPPGRVDSIVKFDNGSFKQGYMHGHPNFRVFEPEDQYKGDFARAFFYIATAYQDYTWAPEASPYMDNGSYLEFRPWLIQLLLEWHRQDPVSQKEINRQQVISSAQHNRNPYIDYPELVEHIWGDRQGQPAIFSLMECTADTGYIPPMQPRDTLSCFDTIISLPALSKNIVNAVSGGYASDKVQPNGSAAITLGTGNTDGWIAFSRLGLTDTTVLQCRASIYNSADRMQLDIYADRQLIASLRDTARMETRNERIYSITVPAYTDSLTLVSVGGSTSCRACLQNFYLLSPCTAPEPPITPLQETPFETEQPTVKFYRNGRIYILRNGITYDIYGQPVR